MEKYTGEVQENIKTAVERYRENHCYKFLGDEIIAFHPNGEPFTRVEILEQYGKRIFVIQGHKSRKYLSEAAAKRFCDVVAKHTGYTGKTE